MRSRCADEHAQKLVPPFVPDPHLVYTPDRVSDFSGSHDMPSQELLDDFKDWGFDGEARGFREELVQFVQKSSTRSILKSMEAPESVLAKLEADGGSETQSGDSSAPAVAEVDLGSRLRELYGSDDAEIEGYDSDDAGGVDDADEQPAQPRIVTA